MHRFSKKGKAISRLALALTVYMIGQSVAVWAGSDRIYPTGKVTLLRGDRTVGVYTREAPLPNGTILSTQGRCGIKLNDLYLVAEDQCVFSINTTGRQRHLFIRQGSVYFKTRGMKHTLTLFTPNGAISVQRIRLNAGFDDAFLKGYISVSDERSELGVAEGGSMDVFTDDGLMTIPAGKKIILAQADMDIGLPEEEPPAAREPPETEKGWSTGTKVAVGTLGVGAVAGILMGLGGGGGGGDGGGGGGSVSPSAP
ncbi:hypothetical protein DSCW_30810 [Desulfosarcina widdelii]|uniref:FecR protein domain-containing protein n=1 Tax=Desulfosarcina widdelii TaxID=947919 RepID=A0A5K7ZB33_9BACT|nr:hypothetical protein [Desulfosarcina widdelii]BBO75664.1 hypothetical protein DSCW_30810 [Desulfosarcina widdelii]